MDHLSMEQLEKNRDEALLPRTVRQLAEQEFHEEQIRALINQEKAKILYEEHNKLLSEMASKRFFPWRLQLISKAKVVPDISSKELFFLWLASLVASLNITITFKET